MRFADGLSLVAGDRVQLQQVLLNLVLNTVEAMGAIEAGPRELSIRTEQDQMEVLVAVGDSGPGIEPERPLPFPLRSRSQAGSIDPAPSGARALRIRSRAARYWGWIEPSV